VEDSMLKEDTFQPRVTPNSHTNAETLEARGKH